MKLVIWLFYKTGLRKFLNWLQRLIKDFGHTRAPLYSDWVTPEELIEYTRERFIYRKDREQGWLRLPFDWSCHPQVFQARLNARQVTGDCDDYHTYIAAQLRRRGYKVWMLCLMYHVHGTKKPRGHTVCVYHRYRGLNLVNYQVEPVQNLRAVPLKVAMKQLGSGKAVVDWAVWEDGRFGLNSIYPKHPAVELGQ